MLKELVDYLFGLGEKAALSRAARVFNVPGDGRTVLFEHNGSLLEASVPPPLRSHEVDSVADLIAAAKRWGSDDTGFTIWISDGRVSLVIDDRDRREFVTLDLKETTAFQTVRKLCDTGRMDQTSLLRLLRRELRGANNVQSVITAVSKIKFSRSERGESNMNHGNESMGKSIEVEVVGAGDIARLITIPLSVYKNPGEGDFSTVIALDLEIVTHEQKFLLKPMPDEVDLALAGAMASIHKKLLEGLGTDAPIFYGRP